jgi:hypothetical protein
MLGLRERRPADQVAAWQHLGPVERLTAVRAWQAEQRLIGFPIVMEKF